MFWCEFCEETVPDDHECESFGKPYDPEKPLSDQG